MGDEKYGIIREQGEYMDPVMLSDEDNEKVIRQEKKEKEEE